MVSYTARGSIAVTAFVLACFAFANPAQTSAIRFDGVYYAPVPWPPGWGLKAKKGSGLFLYFRFYPNDSVVSALSTGTPMEVAKFIRRNLEESGNGTYSISGDRLHFRVTTRNGSIIYSGRVHGDSLALRSYGSISVPLYQFAPVRFAK
jgi:hypothetical protein